MKKMNQSASHDTKDQIHQRACRRHKRIGPGMTEISGIDRNRLGISESCHQHHQASENIQVNHRIHRQTSCHPGRRITKTVGNIGMGKFMKTQRENQRKCQKDQYLRFQTE